MGQLLEFINKLNTAQRAVIIGGFAVLFVFLVGLLIYSSIKAQDEKLNYTIASNLTKTQVMEASAELEASGVPFAVLGSGNNLVLKTNKEFINIAKIKLVTSEASTNKHTGWEIFEKSSLGTTNFENRVKYLRALEGELSRSLESLSGILRASVKIAIPKDSIFTQRKTLPSASAVLTMKPGVFLTQNQIDGVKNFIASAVPKLTSANIKLIDQDGSLLEQSKDDLDDTKYTRQDKYKEKVERDFENKIIALLEPFVGMERVVAKVSVVLDFTRKELQRETFEPEGTVRSAETTEIENQSQSSGEDNGGVPGVQSNIQNPQAANSGGTNSTSRNTENKTITNYEISKTVENQKDAGYASIRRINAAVTFDNTVLQDVENKEEFINSLEKIVEDSIGFDERRGDSVTVRDFKFVGFSGGKILKDGVLVDANSTQSLEDATDTVALVKSLLRDFSEYIQYLIAAVLLYVFYKKFIVDHEVVIIGDKRVDADGNVLDEDGNPVLDSIIEDYEHEFDTSSAYGRLKAKVKSQIMNNIDGLDEEEAAKYEVLIEELDKKINKNPEEIAQMIELLLTEGNQNHKPKKKDN
jgi:flagellar M-ring protein FliF